MSNGDIAGTDQTGATPENGSLRGYNHRLLTLGYGVIHGRKATSEFGIFEKVVLTDFLEHFEVRPGAKGWTVPSKHDDADRGVAAGMAQGFGQLPDESLIEGVMNLGSGHGQGANGARIGEAQMSHQSDMRRTPPSPPATNGVGVHLLKRRSGSSSPYGLGQRNPMRGEEGRAP